MKLLADTHLLLWGAENSTRASKTARRLLDDPDSQVWFSAASIWEVAIKRARGRADFEVDPMLLRRGLLANDWRELPVTGEHAAGVLALPPIHKDPFDRLLIAQAQLEGLTLLTSDRAVAKYPGAIRKV
ncbi:MAG: type II toxin-antitoxin system VapC family toxin [Vitreimonas sp.]